MLCNHMYVNDNRVERLTLNFILLYCEHECRGCCISKLHVCIASVSDL